MKTIKRIVLTVCFASFAGIAFGLSAAAALRLGIDVLFQ
jgi:hypothetical protein